MKNCPALCGHYSELSDKNLELYGAICHWSNYLYLESNPARYYSLCYSVLFGIWLISLSKNQQASKLIRYSCHSQQIILHTGTLPKFVYILLYNLFLFGKNLFPMQDKPVNNKQTHFLKRNFSVTITNNRQKVCVVDYFLY